MQIVTVREILLSLKTDLDSRKLLTVIIFFLDLIYKSTITNSDMANLHS
jgi:hypothetical protein